MINVIYNIYFSDFLLVNQKHILMVLMNLINMINLLVEMITKEVLLVLEMDQVCTLLNYLSYTGNNSS